MDNSDGEEEASPQQSAPPRRRPEKDIQISDSDVNAVSPVLSGYVVSTCLSPLHRALRRLM